MLKTFLGTSLQWSFKLVLSDIAVDLEERQRDHFRLLWPGVDPNFGIYGGEGGNGDSNGLLRFMCELENRSKISSNKTEMLKIVLRKIGRADLVEEKILVFEFQRELLDLIGFYGSLLLNGGGDGFHENQPAMKAAQKLRKYVTGNHNLDVFMEQFWQQSTDDKMLGMLECYCGDPSWTIVARIVILAAEMVCRATKSELENCLIWKITDKITRFLWPWTSRNGSWVSVLIKYKVPVRAISLSSRRFIRCVPTSMPRICLSVVSISRVRSQYGVVLGIFLAWWSLFRQTEQSKIYSAAINSVRGWRIALLRLSDKVPKPHRMILQPFRVGQAMWLCFKTGCDFNWSSRPMCPKVR